MSVGLHAQAPCSRLPLHVRPTISASRSADRPQSRRRCGPVSAQSLRGPSTYVNSSITLCLGAHDCVRVRGHVLASSCMPVHVCPREPTACKIWRMQPRAYVELGAGVGVGVGAGVGLHAQTACSMLPLTCADHSASRSADRPQSRRGCGPVSAHCQRGLSADVNSSVTLCLGAHDCVRVRWHMRASSCMPVHACT